LIWSSMTKSCPTALQASSLDIDSSAKNGQLHSHRCPVPVGMQSRPHDSHLRRETFVTGGLDRLCTPGAVRSSIRGVGAVSAGPPHTSRGPAAESRFSRCQSSCALSAPSLFSSETVSEICDESDQRRVTTPC
jgi:hypothetical protein